MAGIPSFAFGAGFQAKTPKEAARNRAVYEQLAARGGAPQNVGEGLNRVGEALLARSMLDRATAGEEAGQARVAELVSGFGDGADQTELMTAMSDPWLAENPAGSMVAQTLLQRELKKGEPAWQTFESGGDMYRYNENDPNSAPSLFFDAPDAPAPLPEAPQIETRYNPETGMDEKVQWNPNTSTWDAFGGQKAPDKPLVEVNTGENSNKFNDEASKLAAGRMSEIVTSGQGAQSFMGDINALTEIGKTLKTGKEAEVLAALGPYAEAAGIKMDGLGEAQAYEAIVSRMAPAMRIPGSGASSDFDARQFLKSLPALGNTPEGNAIIQQTFTAIQQAKIDAMNIAQRALSGEISWNDADKLIAAIGDPFTAFNDYKAKSKTKSTGAAPEGVDPSLWDVMTPEERSLWQ